MLSGLTTGSFFTPGHAASVAALLVALGVEVNQAVLTHAFEIVGAIIALWGIFMREAPPNRP
ncbi:MAG: hypothetical protein J2P48_13545 [Alphaproteobacteria bacterium]|nr:hypothetical protein [Alphaproteobacteria bacterium]